MDEVPNENEEIQKKVEEAKMPAEAKEKTLAAKSSADPGLSSVCAKGNTFWCPNFRGSRVVLVLVPGLSPVLFFVSYPRSCFSFFASPFFPTAGSLASDCPRSCFCFAFYFSFPRSCCLFFFISLLHRELPLMSLLHR